MLDDTNISASPAGGLDTGPASLFSTFQGEQTSVSVDATAPEIKYKFGTKDHDELLGRLIARRNLGRKAIQDRSDDWDDIDDLLKMRINLTRGARNGDGSRSSTVKEANEKRSVVVPLMFATLQVRMAQIWGMWTGRDPAAQIEGSEPSDVNTAKLMEAAIAYDFRQMNYPMVAYQAIWDAERYGIAGILDTWEVDTGWITRSPKRKTGDLPPILEKISRLIQPQDWEQQRDWGPRREYNLYRPINPRCLYVDPRHSFANQQDGEFVGMSSDVGYMYVVERSQDNDGPFFNVDAVKEHAGAGQRSASARREHLGEKADHLDHGTYGLDHLQIKLIPREWGLGDGDRPERWWFSWIDDTVIVRCHRSSYAHDKYTIGIGESIPDAHGLDNPGWGEQLYPASLFMNWLANSHIAGIKRWLRNAAVYAPSLINEADLFSPLPNGGIRLTPKGETSLLNGSMPGGIMGAFAQLPVTDMTSPHMQMMSVLADFTQRMSAANDPMQGQTTQDKRTLGEVQQIVSSASQRIGTTAKLLDYQLIAPIMMRTISNRRQFTTAPQWYRVGGDLARELEARVASEPDKFQMNGGILQALVNPEDLSGNYDYISRMADGGQDASRSPQVWSAILEMVGQAPQLITAGSDGRQLDVREIFNELFRSAGIKNIDSFWKTPPQPMMPPGMDPMALAMAGGPGGADVQVVPDEQYQAGVQAGNYVDPQQVA